MTPRPVDPSTDVHAALAAPMRRRLLAHLESAGTPLDVHELAEEVGLHPSTVRFHLETLLSADLVERVESTSATRRDTVGRPRAAYAAVTSRSTVPGYEDLSRLLSAGLGETPEVRERRAERVGAAWAGEVTVAPEETPVTVAVAAERTTTLLADLGFRPSVVEHTGRVVRIALHGCPFRAVARERPEVCSLHRGLLTGSLEAMGGPMTGRLLPFVEPELCMVHLETAG